MGDLTSMKNFRIIYRLILAMAAIFLIFLGVSQSRKLPKTNTHSDYATKLDLPSKKTTDSKSTSLSKSPLNALVINSSPQPPQDLSAPDMSNMSTEELLSEKEGMEEDIMNQGIVEKLNTAEGEVHAKLRQEWAPKFERLVTLRKEILQRTLATLTRKVDQMTAQHEKAKEKKEGLNEATKTEL